MSVVIPPSPIGNTPTSTNAEGFLLLTISNAILTSTASAHPVSSPIVGTLSLECVTINVSDPLERDVWLVLRVEPPLSPITNQPHSGQHGFEYPLPSTQKIILNRVENRYTMPVVSGGELTIRLPKGVTEAQKEDLETLEVLLAQYAVLQIQEGPVPETHGAKAGGSASPVMSTGMAYDVDGDLKGRLVLVNEDNGQVVGTLGDQFEVREDAALRIEGHEKDPVVVEIPEDEAWGTGRGWSVGEDGRPKVRKQIFVHPIAADDNDWISRTAGFLGRGVVYGTNLVTTGMTSATNLYISKTTPAPEPIVFSETTKRNVKRVHNISGKAVTVTAKTTGLIHQTVERLADKVSGHKPAPPQPQSGTSTPGSTRGPPAYPGNSTGPPRLQTTSGSSSAAQTPPPPLPKRRLLNRLLTSTDLLLTTVEHSAHHLISHTTNSLSAAAHHKYGTDAGNAVGMVGDSMKNVGVVYIDARGVGRRALLKCAGKRIIRAKMGGKDVVFQDQGAGRGTVVMDEKDQEQNHVPIGVTHGPPSGAPPSYGAPPPFPPPSASSNVPYAPYKRGTHGQ